MDLREKVAELISQWVKKGAPIRESGEMSDRILRLIDPVRLQRDAFVEGAKWQSYRMGDEIRMIEEAKAMYGGE